MLPPVRGRSWLPGARAAAGKRPLSVSSLSRDCHAMTIHGQVHGQVRGLSGDPVAVSATAAAAPAGDPLAARTIYAESK